MGGRFRSDRFSTLPRFAVVGLVSGLAAGCSSDVARFGGNPFSNPFPSTATAQAAAMPDPSATGSLSPVTPVPAGAVQSAPLAPLSSGPVASQPLPPPVATAAYNQPPAIAPSRLAATAPAAPPTPARAPASRSGGPAGWTTQGGTSVTVGTGESAAVIAGRYNVPVNALLSANGLANASQVTPGRTIVIPVFNAVSTESAVPTAFASGSSTPAAPKRAEAPEKATAKTLAEARKTVEESKRTAEAPTPRVRPGMTAKADPATQKGVTPPVRQAAAPAPAKPAAPVKQSAPAQPAAKPVVAKVEAPKPAPAKPEPPKQVAAAKPAPAKPEAPKQVVAAKPEAPKPAPAKPEPPKQVTAAKPEPVRQAALAKVEAPKPEAKPAAPAPKDPDQTASLPQAAAAPAADFRWPARGRVINGFGSSGNEGINIAVPEGTPVKAAGDGVVAYAGDELKGYGKLVLIRHDNGYVSAYAHNGELGVKRGDKVRRGQTIAKSGQTGNVNSPQLHFEIRRGSTPVDPVPYLGN